MAVSKRTRYEVLKRDNHTCRYCGASAPDATLVVDHVTPVALGGTDKPENLVAACKDCNSGKSSTSPDAGMVDDVKQADLKWAQAIARVAEARAAETERRQVYLDSFLVEWDAWRYGWSDERAPLPSNWSVSLERFYELQVPADDIRRCVDIACGNDRIARHERFRYFAGCVWRIVTEMQEAAKALLEVDDD